MKICVEDIRHFVVRRIQINASAIMMNRLNNKKAEYKYTAKKEEAQTILDFIDTKKLKLR